MIVVGVDPGAKHTGYAWYDRANGHRPTERGAGTMDTPEFPEFLDEKLEHYVRYHGAGEVTLVIEEFRLYASHAMSQAWDQMATSELIGALKWIAKKHGVEVVEQGASIKKPTRAQLKPRGIKPIAKDVHSKDAELHLLYYVLREGLWV